MFPKVSKKQALLVAAVGTTVLVLGLILGALVADAGPSKFRRSLRYVFGNGFEFDSGATADFTNATVSGLTATMAGDITLENSETIGNATDGTITFGRNDAGTLTLIGKDDAGAANLVVDTTGAGSITVGSADVTSVVTTTDGGSVTLDGTIALPNAEVIDNTTDGTITFTRNDSGILTIIGADDAGAADTAYDTTGAGKVYVGSADVTDINLVTDSTGDAEVVLPTGSVSGTEILDSTITPADIDLTNFIGADPGATCTAGQWFIDIDETVDTNCTTTADNSLCLCIATDTWTGLEN